MQVAAPPVPAPVEPESVVRRRVARTARREEFDRFIDREHAGLLAEVTILVDDHARAARRLRRALAGTWRDWERVREDRCPADRVRERVLARLDHGARTPRGRPVSGNRPVTLTALAELPVVQRQALVLHHVLGRTVAQVAADTGAPGPTVRLRLAHGAWALANRHPHVHAIPVPRAAPRPRPGPRTRVLTDALEGWAATELEVLRETLRHELAAGDATPTGARVRHHHRRRQATTGAAIAIGGMAVLAVVGASVHGLSGTPAPPPAPASSAPPRPLPVGAVPASHAAPPGPLPSRPVDTGPVVRRPSPVPPSR